MMVTRKLSAAATVLLVGTALLFSGCASKSKGWKFASWDVRKAVGLKKDEKPEPEVPARLVATWTDTVLNTVGEKPKRGFGGRLSFFKRDSDEPVRVEGQLVVYAFDETSRPSHETQPTRKYIFPAEEVVRHESESRLGPSYSFWLPWDEAGGPPRNISLIARFEPTEGPIVIGEQTRHLLPGTMLARDSSPASLASPLQRAGAGHTEAGQAVRLATYSQQAAGTTPVPTLADEAAIDAGAAKKQMSTATIALPPRLGSALQRQQQTSRLDASGVPLSQISKMNRERSVVAANTSAGPQVQAAPTEPTTSSPSSAPNAAAPTAAAGPPAPGRLRDSLLETLPARATRAGRPAAGRAH